MGCRMTMNLVDKPSLAIVIPAYKDRFLQETLESIAAQTDKEFVVYIGNDAGSPQIPGIVETFSDRMNIVYHYFPNNLGCIDLVAHWERCIDLIQDEEWVWLFSDDDVMGQRCVESFRQMIEREGNHDIYHFDVKQIDERGLVVDAATATCFPDVISVPLFAKKRTENKINSFVVEFILRKSRFIDEGRYQKFDLAWGSDVATCIKVGHPNGIRNIPGEYVYWRASSLNISPNNSQAMIARKLGAFVEYVNWLVSFSKDRRLGVRINPIGLYLRRLLSFRFRVRFIQVFRDIYSIHKNVGK